MATTIWDQANLQNMQNWANPVLRAQEMQRQETLRQAARQEALMADANRTFVNQAFSREQLGARNAFEAEQNRLRLEADRRNRILQAGSSLVNSLAVADRYGANQEADFHRSNQAKLEKDALRRPVVEQNLAYLNKALRTAEDKLFQAGMAKEADYNRRVRQMAESMVRSTLEKGVTPDWAGAQKNALEEAMRKVMTDGLVFMNSALVSAERAAANEVERLTYDRGAARKEADELGVDIRRMYELEAGEGPAATGGGSGLVLPTRNPSGVDNTIPGEFRGSPAAGPAVVEQPFGPPLPPPRPGSPAGVDNTIPEEFGPPLPPRIPGSPAFAPQHISPGPGMTPAFVPQEVPDFGATQASRAFDPPATAARFTPPDFGPPEALFKWYPFGIGRPGGAVQPPAPVVPRGTNAVQNGWWQNAPPPEPVFKWYPFGIGRPEDAR